MSKFLRGLRWMAWVFVLAAGAAIAQGKEKPAPDVLVFTNGDQLTGKFERAVGGNVIFKSDMAGEITIGLDKVKELRSGSDFVALKKAAKNNPVAAVGAVQVSAGNVVVTRADGQAETIAPKDLGFLIDRATYDKEVSHRPGILHAWNGTLTGGASLVRSTQTATTFTAAASLVRAVPTVPYLPARNRTVLNVAETYGKQTSPVIPPTAPPTSVTVLTNIFHLDSERDEYFSPRLYALGDVSFDHNFAQGLQLQQVYGGGVGWTVVKGARQELDVKGDVHYERQAYFSATEGVAAAPSVELFGSTFAETYQRTLPRKMTFTQNASILPAWNQTSAYSANASAMLALPVWKRLSASVAVTDNFLNDPAPFYKKNSFQFVTGVTYALR